MKLPLKALRTLVTPQTTPTSYVTACTESHVANDRSDGTTIVVQSIVVQSNMAHRQHVSRTNVIR